MAPLRKNSGPNPMSFLVFEGATLADADWPKAANLTLSSGRLAFSNKVLAICVMAFDLNRNVTNVFGFSYMPAKWVGLT